MEQQEQQLRRIPKVNACSLNPSQVNPDSQNDFGSYNCTASNEVGTESKEFILIQAGPSALCDSTLTQTSATSSELLSVHFVFINL